MKRLALLPLLATAALAAQAQSFLDQARVQRVEPQYETVQLPREECASHWVTEPQPAAGGYGGAVIGGLAGGILGNQVGKGHGREAATAAGAVIGAIAGDRMANGFARPYPQAQREVRTCRTVYDAEQRLTGYRVTYEYRGHQSTVMTQQQPGQTLPVRVSVTPAEEREYHRPY